MIRAIVPIQAQSRQLKRKEFLDVCGKPMFYWAIHACMDASFIDKVYISTNFDHAYRQIKPFFPHPNLVRINRPLELHGDVELLDVMKHAACEIGEDGDIFIQVQANKPLTTAKDLDEYINEFLVFQYNTLFQVQKINSSVNWEYKQSRRHGNDNFKSCSVAKIWDYDTLINSKSGTWGMGKKHCDYLIPHHHIEVDSKEDLEMAIALKNGEF
jgi:CMP-N,N'-diacetyllegionaminic acid synthase|tara:strand:- start:4846 stop:5484 length:639 start_codon:yes stop_codon:yes gene_type:complete